MNLRAFAASVLAAALAVSPVLAQDKVKTIRAVMHSDLKVLDPIWTTANIVRNHGYMVWDTLFAMDEKLTPQPQMVDTWDVSADRLTYSFTLRDDLKWHDGKPVTSEDCIASLKRWGARDSTGLKLMSFVSGMEAVNDKTFRIVLKEPYGLVIDSLAKPGGSTPLMMPKRIADTDPNKQISEFIGSGPFIFKTDEWKPGDRTVYVRNPDYVPRKEPPSGLAGGKVAKVDRVEWLAIPDHQTAVNALLAGEIDYIEAPPHDLKPLLLADKSIKLEVYNKIGAQYAFRWNTVVPPFNNEKIRRAAMYAFDQKSFLEGVIGDSNYYQTCDAMFVCGTPLENSAGMDGLTRGNFAKSKELLKEAGYDGRADQRRADRQGSAREGRLQGRDGAARLPGDRGAPAAQDPAGRRRLERLHDGLALGRHDEPADQQPGRGLVRQGQLRLAVRCGGRAPARRLCQGAGRREPPEDRRPAPGTGRDLWHAHPARPIHPADGHARPVGHGHQPDPGVLEHREEVTRSVTLSGARSAQSKGLRG
jgi:ABC-type transport system substrate-binding protein